MYNYTILTEKCIKYGKETFFGKVEFMDGLRYNAA